MGALKENQLELALDLSSSLESENNVIFFPSDKVKWKDDEIKLLRSRLLWECLRILVDGRAGDAIKHEIMEWIMSDDIEPFSFVTCCAEEGYQVSKIRDGVKSTLNKLKKIL